MLFRTLAGCNGQSAIAACISAAAPKRYGFAMNCVPAAKVPSANAVSSPLLARDITRASSCTLALRTGLGSTWWGSRAHPAPPAWTASVLLGTGAALNGLHGIPLVPRTQSEAHGNRSQYKCLARICPALTTDPLGPMLPALPGETFTRADADERNRADPRPPNH